MRKLNVKFLLCLVAAAVVFGGGVVLAHSLQFKRIPLALLKQARKAEDEGDLNRTIGYLNRYLVFAPDDAEQRIRLALLLADPKLAVTAKARSNAFEALEKALSYDASRHDLRRLAVPLAIELHKLSRAKEYLQQLPADGERAALWGKWYEAQQTFPEAVHAYREAVKLSPAQTDNYVRLARLLSEGRADPPGTSSPKSRAAANHEADQVMASLVAKNPKSWRAYIARWNLRRDFSLRKPRQDNRSTFLKTVSDILIQEAGEDVARALELAEGELDVRLAAAELSQLQDELGAARSHLDKAMQLHRKDSRIYRAFAGLELQVEEKTKDLAEKKRARARAEAWLRQGVRELVPPAQIDVLWAHTSLLIDSGGPAELDEASKVIDKIRDANFLPAGVTFLRGRVLFARQQWAEAAKLLERARAPLESSTDLTNQINTMLVRCFTELDDRARQRDVCERLAKQNPNSVTAKLALVNAKQRAGDLKEALDDYKQLLKMEDVPPGTWAEMLRLRIVMARQAGNEAWQGVDEALDEAENEKKADKVEMAILRAESLVAQQKPEEAQRVLEKAKGTNPERVELWIALAGLAEHRRNPAQALKVLDEADADKRFSKSADQAELKLARARHWVDQHDEKGRTELKKLEKGLDRYPDQRNYLLNGLAEAHYRAGNFGDAARLWKVLAAQEEYRQDLRLRLVLFDLALQAGKGDEMADILRDIESLEGKDGTFGRHAQALRLVWEVKQGKLNEAEKERKLAEALRHLEQVKAARGSWAAPLLTEAEIETLRGNPDRVIECYRQARNNGDRNPLVVRHLVEALRKQGKLKDAEEELRKLTRADLVNAELRREVSILALQGGKSDQAVKYALGAVQDDSQDYRDHLWLGRLLAAAGKDYAKQAEEHLRRAVQLGQSEPEPYVALVAFLASQKERTAEAESVLAEVRVKVPAKQQPLTLARCFAHLGKGEARETYEAALKANPDDPAVLKDFVGFYLQREQFKEAEPLLRRLLDRQRKLSEEDAQWAHARLALLLASGNDFARFKEALLHVGLKLEEDGTFARDTRLIPTETTDVRRFGARVLATQPQWRCRDEAIKRFEELERKQALTADDRFILARLYEARQDWTKMQTQFAEIARLDDCRPNHLVAYAQALLRYNQKDDARRVLDRLTRMQTARPDPAIQIELIDLQARWYEANRQGEKAEQLLTEFINRPGSKPQAILLLVASLARQQRFDKALELLDRVWKSCSAEIAGATSVALLRSTRATDEQQEDIVKRLKAAREKEPKNANLIVQLGDVRDIQNLWEQAEGLYREALKINHNDALALNNLAWLVAQREKNGEKALELVNRAIALNGPRGELLDTRAVAYIVLGKPNEAIQDLKDAIQESLTPTRCFHLARAYHLAKNREAAARELRKAKDLGLQTPQLHPVEQHVYDELRNDLR